MTAERAFAWAGGGLFAGSLVFAAWSYVLAFGQPASWTGWAPVLVDTALLTAFAFHHSLFAREPVKRAIARICPERLLRSAYVWIASLLFAGVCLFWRTIGGTAYDLVSWPRVLLFGVQVVGVGFAIQAARAIDPLELAGIRTRAGTGTLEHRGPYALVRHPLYLGWVLMVGAAPHMTGDRLVFALVTIAYLLVAITWEERSLESNFGEAYRRYQARVRWRIVPFLY